MDRTQDVRDERTVLIVDDHRSFAEALAIAIDMESGLRCVALAETAAEGLDAALRWQPDVALVDMYLPDDHGGGLVSRLRERHEDLAVLAVTAHADAATVAAAAQAGVCGFLRKECSVEDILDAISSAGRGSLTIDASTLGAMLAPRSGPPARTAAGEVHLTPREHEVLDLLSRAHDVASIARRLGVSIHTVRGYVKALLAKLDAHSQLEAVVRAKALGLVVDAPPEGHRALAGAARASR